MKHSNFPSNYKLDNLRTSRVWEMEWLQILIRDWLTETGWIMRPYRRDLVKQQIKRIRIIDSNIQGWLV